MNTATGLFHIECTSQTLIVTVTSDLRECNYPDIEAGAEEILHILDGGKVRNIVLDLQRTDYYGSTALGIFVKLWKRVKERDGHMALCGLSDLEKEILKVTHLYGLWPICPSRQEALKVIELQDELRRVPQGDMDSESGQRIRSRRNP
jgi:anti-anti-sigma factor